MSMYLVSAKCVFISWFSVCKVREEMEVGTQVGDTEQLERREEGGREGEKSRMRGREREEREEGGKEKGGRERKAE